MARVRFVESATDSPRRGPAVARAVAVDGTLAYVADGLTGLKIADVSDRDFPTILGAHDTTGEAFALEYPFYNLPNFIGSPHIADHVPGAMPNATRLALENVRKYLLGEDIRGVLKRSDYL